MIITHTADVKRKPTQEEIKLLNALKDRPIVYDEDSPELTDEQLSQFHRIIPPEK